MQAGDIELVVGIKRDKVFGAMVMVGYGGIFLETLRDVVFRRAPFTELQARSMLGELRMRPVLDGVRGRPGADIDKLCSLLSRLSCWASSVAPQLAELDLNPLLIDSDGPVGVDSIMIIRTKTEHL